MIDRAPSLLARIGCPRAVHKSLQCPLLVAAVGRRGDLQQTRHERPAAALVAAARTEHVRLAPRGRCTVAISANAINHLEKLALGG